MLKAAKFVPKYPKYIQLITTNEIRLYENREDTKNIWFFTIYFQYSNRDNNKLTYSNKKKRNKFTNDRFTNNLDIVHDISDFTFFQICF